MLRYRYIPVKVKGRDFFLKYSSPDFTCQETMARTQVYRASKSMQNAIKLRNSKVPFSICFQKPTFHVHLQKNPAGITGPNLDLQD
jgi:hypothetical protein